MSGLRKGPGCVPHPGARRECSPDSETNSTEARRESHQLWESARRLFGGSVQTTVHGFRVEVSAGQPGMFCDG